GFPEGMGFYYSSPLKGWLAWPLLSVFGLGATWNLLLLLARVCTVLFSWAAARAWGFGGSGSLAVAAVYGASPFFHGYAVEGIVEGTDGWTLALWAWMVGRGRHGWAALALALTVLSSWYLGMACCALAAFAGVRDRRAWWSFLGLAAVMPMLMSFAGAFPAMGPLDGEIRASMGAPLGVPTPGFAAGLSPFALNTYVGWTILLVACWSRSLWALLALVPAALSLGVGPLYELPVFELIRFPYRWHAATLVLLGGAVATVADRRGWWWLGPLIVLEGWLLSPVEPFIPGSPSEIPEIYEAIDEPVLEVPGPVAMSPGRVNLSRPRARYLLYFQTLHGQSSPWIPDFNGVGVEKRDDGLNGLRAFDRLEDSGPANLEDSLQRQVEKGVVYLVVQRDALGAESAQRLEEQLMGLGVANKAEDGDRSVWDLRASRSRSPSVLESP
ncbi:MAG: hypothetical protein QGG40_20765, partial [Myxococcota bacterium]|nr:hypothetical protein [Myxococcota bacterium]